MQIHAILLLATVFNALWFLVPAFSLSIEPAPSGGEVGGFVHIFTIRKLASRNASRERRIVFKVSIGATTLEALID